MLGQNGQEGAAASELPSAKRVWLYELERINEPTERPKENDRVETAVEQVLRMWPW